VRPDHLKKQKQKAKKLSCAWWLTPAILATWEGKIGGSQVRAAQIKES
jgi:hypothetical protein